MLPIQSGIESFITSNGWLLVIIGILVGTVMKYQKGLTRTQYRYLHVLKSTLALAFDGPARRRGRPLVRYKKAVGDPEYVETVPRPPEVVYDKLDRTFSGHLPATTKVRIESDGRIRTSYAQMVYVHADKLYQTEVYFFDNHDDTTDVYAHVEPIASDVREHFEGEQAQGDACGAYAMAADGLPEGTRPDQKTTVQAS